MHIMRIYVCIMYDLFYILVHVIEQRPKAKKKSKRELKRIRGSF